jgi:hypothetical protein
MTNVETNSTIYFIDVLVNNTKYRIDIITYPVPTTLPEGFTSSITFPSVAKNPRLKLPAGMNDIFGYDVDFTTDAGGELQTYNSTRRRMYLLIVVYYWYVTKSIMDFKFRHIVCYISACWYWCINRGPTFATSLF